MDEFRAQFATYLDNMQRQVATENGDWTVKGFIDIYKRIYTISIDTKVLSKVLELLLFPVIVRFAEAHRFQILLAPAQNQYPDLTLVSMTDPSECYAVDIKTTYRVGHDLQGNARVNGMTLGTFGGYFRSRDRVVSSTLPYNQYRKHYILGVVYSRVAGIDERSIYQIADLETIPSVVRDFQFFFHEKFQIASDGPGSGNTRNIGSTRYLDRLINGTAVFAELGIEIFDDYWMHYRTPAMARAEGFDAPPYTNLKSYLAHKKQTAHILTLPESMIQSEAAEVAVEDIEDES